MAYATINPATGETLKKFDTATDQEIKDAVQRSAKEYSSWRNVPVAERAQLMHKMAELYRERQDELAAILTEEMGKPAAQAAGEVQIVAAIYDYYADNAEEFMKGRSMTPSTGGEARVVLDSTGVLLGIMPWNFPYYQVARFAAPNVMLGNTILLKHAGNVPQSALVQEELFHEAGFPEDVYINVFASSDQIADIIIPDPAVQGVSLTGSERAGASVAATAGKNLKKVVLELGGSDPFIVLDDKNVERTVKQAVNGRMNNNGQACTNAKRFIVLEDAYETFVENFAEAVQGITPSDPTDEKTFLGPLCTVSARDEIMEQVQDAVDKGATVLAGGKKLDKPGAWMEATLLADVTPEMRAYAEEIFGPVAVVYKVKDVDEAIELANSSSFGLGGSVFGADEAEALEVAKRVDSGMVFVNEVTGTAPDLPFGGVKRSGVGRELGPFGIEEFANKKLLHTPKK